MMTENTDTTIQATANSLNILEAIKELQGVQINEIAAELDLANSTVHGHVTTLEQNGYVVREKGKIYLGLKFFHMGDCATNRLTGLKKAQEKVKSIAQNTNLEVDYNVDERGRLVALAHEIGHSSDIGFQVGEYFYMHNTGSGKAILAKKPRAKVEEILDEWGLPAQTDYTITNREELFKDLKQTRERGYSLCDQEWVEGFRSIGRAVTGPSGEIIGAIAIGGPTYRLGIEQINDEIGRILIESVTDLENQMESSI